MFFFVIYEFIIHLYKTKSDFLKKKFFTKMLIFMWVYHDFFATRIRPNDKDPKYWIKETLNMEDRWYHWENLEEHKYFL